MGSHTSSYILKDFGTLFITGPIGTSHVEDQGRSNGRISSCEETDCLVLSFWVYNKIIMTRGNQRDKAREKAAKADKGKGKAAKDQEGNKGLNMEQRKQRDGDIMRQKQEKKAAEAAAKA